MKVEGRIIVDIGRSPERKHAGIPISPNYKMEYKETRYYYRRIKDIPPY